MRFFLFIVSNGLAAAPSDLCTQLCDRDGPSVCTGGSWTKPDGTCHAYLFRSSGDYWYHTSVTASTCQSPAPFVRAEDVARLLAGPVNSADYHRALLYCEDWFQGGYVSPPQLAEAVAAMDAEFRSAFFAAAAVARDGYEYFILRKLTHLAEAREHDGDVSAARAAAMAQFARTVARRQPLVEGHLVDASYAQSRALDLMNQLQATYGGLNDPETLAAFARECTPRWALAFYRAAWGASAGRWAAMVDNLNEIGAAFFDHMIDPSQPHGVDRVQSLEAQTTTLFEQLLTQ